MSDSIKRFALRLAALVAITLAASGASPGAVGSCSDTSKAIDWQKYCEGEYWAMCLKWDEAIMSAPDTLNPLTGVCEMTGDARADQIVRVCNSVAAAPPCNGPTDLQGEACVEAIYRRPQVSNPMDLPSECVLCGH